MPKMFEMEKIDIGVTPVSLNGNSTSVYYNLADYRKCLAVLQVGAMAITKTAKIEVYQATNAAAGSAKLLTGATATITANTNVTSLSLALATVLATHTIIINGLTFTAHGTVTDVTIRQFSIAGTDTQDGDELATCINDPTYGVPGITATNVTGTLTLVSTVPGAYVITAAQGVGATITVATLKAQSYVEINALTLEAGFTHVATKVTTDAAILVSSILLRGGQRVGITQKIGASASV